MNAEISCCGYFLEGGLADVTSETIGCIRVRPTQSINQSISAIDVAAAVPPGVDLSGMTGSRTADPAAVQAFPEADHRRRR